VGLQPVRACERFVYKAIPREEFTEVFDQVKRWGLDDFLKDRSFENLAAPSGD
jgi:hypothetical protein